MNEWISVKDKLPDNMQFVLTCDKIGNIHMMQYFSCQTTPFGISEDNERFFPPMWWMPLPDPPGE